MSFPSASIDFEWAKPLMAFEGSPKRLQGVMVFHDFPWHNYFDRKAFKNGEAFTRLARRTAESGKQPAILLTELDLPHPRKIHSEIYSLIAINVETVVHATADVGATLVIADHESEALSFGSWDGAFISQAELEAFFDQRLSTEAIRNWASADATRMRELVDALQRESTGVVADPRSLIPLLDSLVTIDPEIADALGRALRNVADREARLALLRALTESSDGIVDAGTVFTERLIRRLENARATAETYDALVASPDSTETDLQNFIQHNPWLVGLEYSKVTPKQPVVRGALDFILTRYDGCQDIMELKSPQDSMIKAAEDEDGVPPPPHAITLSRSLAQAIAQSHDYRHQLSEGAKVLEEEYGLKSTRNPRIFIIIGKTTILTEKAKLIMTELNLTLHRVEIIPFDLLGNRAKTIIRNLELCLIDPPC
ncbi:MAG: DUF4263 domain-containing protein [Fimbriimonas ginsengisoli]|uniref:DUF4263 domain-containing protein n=1 Tax=Fimbriimonas ginsengisoli TaxID=1005039 RepID=A0A931LRW4_FIMGI|nr:DUF4263 domain-containing protein [Fimbriimonas ginsengisoli]